MKITSTTIVEKKNSENDSDSTINNSVMTTMNDSDEDNHQQATDECRPLHKYSEFHENKQTNWQTNKLNQHTFLVFEHHAVKRDRKSVV